MNEGHGFDKLDNMLNIIFLSDALNMLKQKIRYYLQSITKHFLATD